MDLLSGFPRAARLFLLALVSATAVCASCIVFSRLMHYGFPYTSPFFPFHQWLDFFDFRIRFSHFHTDDFFNLDLSKGWIFSYPPPVGMLYELAYLPSKHQYLIFNAVVFPVCGILIMLFAKALRNRDIPTKSIIAFIVMTAFCAYPFYFNFMLGNFEICIFILVAFAIVALLRRHEYLAALLLAVAGSMKIFPLFLLGLFIARRRYKPVFLAMITAAGVYLASAWAECPSLSLAFRGMRLGAEAMRKNLIIAYLSVENSYDHSLFALFKRLSHAHYDGNIPDYTLSFYMVSAAVAGILLFFLRIRNLPFLNQVLSLYIACVLLPPMSHHYTLMHLYVPWALFVLYAVDASRTGVGSIVGLPALLVCFGLLFAPESEFIFHRGGFGGQIKCVLLLVCWAIALKRPFRSKWDHLVLQP